MKYSLFLDETGDHGLSFIDENFPLFLLCGCIFDHNSLARMKNRIDDFKRKYFETNAVILHSRDIRKCEGSFQILFDLNIKEQFYKNLNAILTESDYCLIGLGVQKEKHIKRYGKSAGDPYALSLSFILERLVFFLDNTETDSSVGIMAEKRGKKEDAQLLAHFNSIMDRGTYYVSPERIKRIITSFSFHNKRENVAGLQIADLCAYPMARFLLNPKEPYMPFKIIENKIYKNSRTEQYLGWGLKMFP